MIRIVLKKFLEVVFFIVLITFISFSFLRIGPLDPVFVILNVDEVSVSQDQIEKVREEMGFNDPLLVQYGEWMLDFIRFDFGESYSTGQPVLEMILAKLPITLELSIGAIIVMLLIAIPLGSLSAIYRGHFIDHFARIMAVVGSAIPSFWLGLMFIDLFGVELKWFPTMGRDSMASIVLPSVTLGIAMSGVYVRLLRSSLIEAYAQDFIRAARARGIQERRIFLHYAFRYSLTPVITVFGVSLGSLIGGVVVIEVLFSYPGMGKLMIDAVRQRDYPLIQGYIFVVGVIVFLVNTVVDIVCHYMNAEIRLKEGGAD